ncbi:MAG TPA: 50S ribosomal protein L6 [bacterium]|nr:50S ribosomal protein L6 [bacterium]
MSRLGKLPIKIPNGIQVSINKNMLTVKGTKGELKQEIHPNVIVNINNDEIIVSVKNTEDKKQRALWGLFRALINNMIMGLSEGYEKKLEIKGVGYKVAVSGSNLNLSLGFSHPVVFPLPLGISATVENNSIILKGFDKQLIGEIASQIRKFRKPEPYKGKGIKYSDETIRRKAGKAASK